MEKHLNHHGWILKSYIIDNDVNKKGGINKLTENLKISRQGLYVLYEQREIKKKHRDRLIEYFGLPDNFFPVPISREDEYKTKIIELQEKLIETHEQLSSAQKQLKQQIYSPQVLPMVINRSNKSQIPIIYKGGGVAYVENASNTDYFKTLEYMSLPNIDSGMAFEITDNGMQSVGIKEGDIVICDRLIEHLEEIKENQPYIIVLKSGEILCRYIKTNSNSLRLLAANLEVEPFSLKLEGVFQVWEIYNYKLTKFAVNLVEKPN